MKISTAAQLTLGVALALVSLLAWHWLDQRDDLRAAVSIAAHAADKQGRPVTLSTSGAIAQVRVIGKALDDTRLATKAAEAADATHALEVERKDTQTTKEVSTDVLAQLAQTRDDLADSRALAAQRLRELAAARADQGGGGDPPVAEDADATCRAAFAASCDEVLALLAEAEDNTTKLVGWQRFWPEVVANHEEPTTAPAP